MKRTNLREFIISIMIISFFLIYSLQTLIILSISTIYTDTVSVMKLLRILQGLCTRISWKSVSAIDESGIDNCFKAVDSIMYKNKIKSKKSRDNQTLSDG